MILFLHYWSLLGRSELFLRLPFVIAGILFCWIMFLWIRTVAGKTAACFGLAMFLFAPSLISLSAEIRQYSFLLFFCAGCLYCLERALENDSQKSLWWMAISALTLYLALLTHYSAMIFAAAVALYGLLGLSRKQWPARLTSTWMAGETGALAICAFLYETQISKLRQSGIPSEIASTWLRSSVFQHGHSFAGFAWNNTIRLFRSFFSQGTVGVLGLLLFVYAILFLLRPGNRPERSKARSLAILLAVPFLITLALALFQIYPYGGTRHDALLAIFAFLGIAIAIDRLPAPSRKSTMTLKALLLAAAMLICNFFQSPTGPYIRPLNQHRKLMITAISDLRSLPTNTVLLTDAQGSMVLNYYLCDEGMALPLTSEKPLLKLSCGKYAVITSLAMQTGFDRASFPELLPEAWQVVPEASRLYLFQSGWIDDHEQDWLNQLRSVGGTAKTFGPNILICPIERTASPAHN